MLEVKDLSKIYELGDNQVVSLNNVNLKFKKVTWSQSLDQAEVENPPCYTQLVGC